MSIKDILKKDTADCTAKELKEVYKKFLESCLSLHDFAKSNDINVCIAAVHVGHGRNLTTAGEMARYKL